MENLQVSATGTDDLDKLRAILARASALSVEHSLRSVMVGMAGSDADPDFAELVDYVESELRVEDAVFRMTRDRVVLFVADIDRAGAEEILERLLIGYCARSSRAHDPDVQLRFLEVEAGTSHLTIKDVLPTLFS